MHRIIAVLAILALAAPAAREARGASLTPSPPPVAAAPATTITLDGILKRSVTVAIEHRLPAALPVSLRWSLANSAEQGTVGIFGFKLAF